MELSRNQINLLLYFETAEVDQRGMIQSCRMNRDDFDIAHYWKGSGFLEEFDYVFFNESEDVSPGISRYDYRCKLSEEAWVEAHKQRRLRADRNRKFIKQT